MMVDGRRAATKRRAEGEDKEGGMATKRHKRHREDAEEAPAFWSAAAGRSLAVTIQLKPRNTRNTRKEIQPVPVGNRDHRSSVLVTVQ